MDSRNKLNAWIIIQARVGSSRLPAKVLKIIQGKTVLEHDIERCLRIRRADGVVIATTRESEADKIIQVCKKFPPEKVKYYCGSVDDVLSRYYESAQMVGANAIVRITSDCPLLDPVMVDSMIDMFWGKNNNSKCIDYLSNLEPRSFPKGLDTEIFSFFALECAHKEAQLPRDREHVTTYIRSRPDIFPRANFAQKDNQSGMRWTLDYPEDFEFIKKVYDCLYPKNPEFTSADILSLLEKHPDIILLNQTRSQR
ncbi:glycosyltransferase family protein [Candidatus Sumerlaeota bacterium]|nr:glycosyltransferase family protein [Candidatus Sumerlaeota bacterium]